MTHAVRRLSTLVMALALTGGHAMAAMQTGDATSAPASTLPRALRIVDAVVPDSLVGRCREGFSLLRCRIDLRGIVAEAQVTRGFPVSACTDSATAARIDAATLEAIRGWAFQPATTGGEAHSMVVDLAVYVPPDSTRVPRHDGLLIGTVVDAERGMPIPMATVRFGDTVLRTRSDRHGVFMIGHLVHLTGPVTVAMRGFETDTLVANVRPGFAPDTLRFRLRAVHDPTDGATGAR